MISTVPSHLYYLRTAMKRPSIETEIALSDTDHLQILITHDSSDWQLQLS